MNDADGPSPLDYRTPRKTAPYSRRAVTAFVLALVSAVSFTAHACLMATHGFLPSPAADSLCLTPFTAIFALTIGLGAYGHFPDHRGLMHRGRWMATTSILIAALILFSIAAFLVFGVLLHTA